MVHHPGGGEGESGGGEARTEPAQLVSCESAIAAPARRKRLGDAASRPVITLGVAMHLMTLSTSSIAREGLDVLSKATAPATWGHAIEVPER